MRVDPERVLRWMVLWNLVERKKNLLVGLWLWAVE